MSDSWRLLGAQYQLTQFWEQVDKECAGRYEQVRKRAVREWCEFLQSAPGELQAAVEWGRAEPVHIAYFVEWLGKKPGCADEYGQPALRAPGTIAVTIYQLKLISRRLHSLGLLEKNSFAYVTPPEYLKNQKRPFKRIPEEHIRKLFGTLSTSQPKELELLAILSLILGGGLRLEEVSKLKIGDIRQKDDVMYVTLKATKSGVDQIQSISPHVAVYVHLFHGSQEHRGTHEKLFSYTGAGMRKRIKTHCRNIGIPEYTPHSFRTTAINQLLEEKVPLLDVRDFARHQSADTTLRYDKREKSITNSISKKIKF